MTKKTTAIQPQQTALVVRRDGNYQIDSAFGVALKTWAEGCTDSTSARFKDLVHDKVIAVAAFFAHVAKAPDQVTALDVKTWQAHLENLGLAASTVYGRISRLSSFFTWLMQHPDVRGRIGYNPVSLARPKAPKAYQTESTQALTADEVRALLAVVRARAESGGPGGSGDVVGKRDYALLLIYFLTGLRRNEVISLKWRHVRLEGGRVLLSVRLKGGERHQVEVRGQSQAVWAALQEYLRAAGRLDSMTPESPIWVAHDPSSKGADGTSVAPLSSHGFVKNFKRYAREAGLGTLHLHQTRHTVAREVADQLGIKAAQEQLGHKNEATTRVYVQRVTTRRDKTSDLLADAFGIGEATLVPRAASGDED